MRIKGAIPIGVSAAIIYGSYQLKQFKNRVNAAAYQSKYSQTANLVDWCDWGTQPCLQESSNPKDATISFNNTSVVVFNQADYYDGKKGIISPQFSANARVSSVRVLGQPNGITLPYSVDGDVVMDDDITPVGYGEWFEVKNVPTTSGVSVSGFVDGNNVTVLNPVASAVMP